MISSRPRSGTAGQARYSLGVDSSKRESVAICLHCRGQMLCFPTRSSGIRLLTTVAQGNVIAQRSFLGKAERLTMSTIAHICLSCSRMARLSVGKAVGPVPVERSRLKSRIMGSTRICSPETTEETQVGDCRIYQRTVAGKRGCSSTGGRNRVFKIPDEMIFASPDGENLQQFRFNRD